MQQAQDHEAPNLSERLLPAVRRVMQVNDVAQGGPGQRFAARFRGRLMIGPEEAYARLEPVFADADVTLVFRRHRKEHLVLALPGVIRPRASNPWWNLVLFLLTLGSVMFTGALNAYEGPLDAELPELLMGVLRNLPKGIPFAASLLAILVAHEFGHYLAARYHKTAVSLPYFLPFPGSPFGTMGAFIQLKQPPRNRKVLHDIGLAGPLAGLAVAIPILLLGLWLSDVDTLPAEPGGVLQTTLEGNSILYLASKYLVKGELLPAPLDYGGVSPVVYWVRYVMIGRPIPFGGRDVLLHPIALAGWAGLLVTALNLIPAGQLDGGHTIYVLLGRHSAILWPVIVAGLLALGIVWSGWWLWAALIFFLGRTYAQPLDEITPLDPRRKLIAIFGLIVFVLVFTPVPLLPV